MQIEELRIGNLIYGVSDRLEIITELKKNTCITDHYKNNLLSAPHEVEYRYISSIPLTEEILLKCKGVIKHPTINNRYLLEDSNYSFHIEDGDWDNPSLDILINGIYIVCVEFLHEFQNLIYTLTNKELNIEL